MVAGGEEEIGPDAVNLAGVAAEKGRAERAANYGCFGIRTGIGLAETGEPLVGVNTNPEPVDRAGVDTDTTAVLDQLEGGDLQSGSGRFRLALPRAFCRISAAWSIDSPREVETSVSSM